MPTTKGVSNLFRLPNQWWVVLGAIGQERLQLACERAGEASPRSPRGLGEERNGCRPWLEPSTAGEGRGNRGVCC